MRILLTWIDQLRTTKLPELAAFCAALVSQLQEIAAAANTWATINHDSDGTHTVVAVGDDDVPAATVGKITIYSTDGATLKVVKADGTIGTITVV